MGFDLEGCRVDLNDFALVFDVDVDVARAVGHRKLRYSAKLNFTDDPARGCINDRRGLAGFVADEEPSRDVVIDHAVRVSICLDPASNCERLRIEGDDFILLSVAQEAGVQFVNDNNPMNEAKAAERSNALLRIEVENDHLAGMRDIQASRLCVSRQVVPRPVAAERNRRGELVILSDG